VQTAGDRGEGGGGGLLRISFITAQRLLHEIELGQLYILLHSRKLFILTVQYCTYIMLYGVYFTHVQYTGSLNKAHEQECFGTGSGSCSVSFQRLGAGCQGPFLFCLEGPKMDHMDSPGLQADACTLFLQPQVKEVPGTGRSTWLALDYKLMPVLYFYNHR
jgi:hypothetical protein